MLGALLACLLALAACSANPPGGAAAPTGVDGARQALLAFFQHLHAGEYQEAAGYFGGEITLLQDYNPDLDPGDLAGLLGRACTVNGFVCLPVQDVLSVRQASPGEFTFEVQFAAEDGSTFALGPCCGATATEMPPQTAFTYTVNAFDERFLVAGLPPYRP